MGRRGCATGSKMLFHRLLLYWTFITCSHICTHLRKHSLQRHLNPDSGWNSKRNYFTSNVNALTAPKAKQRIKAKLLAYLKANRSRMDYKHYQTIGCGIIGSGAVESAHRTVVQKRMK